MIEKSDSKRLFLATTSILGQAPSTAHSLDEQIKENEAVINNKYDAIIKSRYTPAHFLIYWFFCSACLILLFNFIIDEQYNSIISGLSSGLIISIILRNYSAYRKQKSKAYADLKKQRAYAIKAMQYSFLHPPSVEDKASYASQAFVFQNATAQQIKKVNKSQQPALSKTPRYKWTFILLFLIILIFLSLINSINKTALYQSITSLPTTTIDKKNNIEKTASPKKKTTTYKTDKDLRHCLKLSTKKEVIQCTEKVQ